MWREDASWGTWSPLETIRSLKVPIVREGSPWDRSDDYAVNNLAISEFTSRPLAVAIWSCCVIVG